MVKRNEGGGLVAAPSTDEVLERLENLWNHLDHEGQYVKANTVALAIDEIKRLRK
jgi:hypothetical protein